MAQNLNKAAVPVFNYLPEKHLPFNLVVEANTNAAGTQVIFTFNFNNNMEGVINALEIDFSELTMSSSGSGYDLTEPSIDLVINVNGGIPLSGNRYAYQCDRLENLGIRFPANAVVTVTATRALGAQVTGGGAAVVSSAECQIEGIQYA